MADSFFDFTPEQAEAFGAATAITGLFGMVGDVFSQRNQLKIKQSELDINKMFAKSAFQRRMESLFQQHRDLESQVAQQQRVRDAQFQKKAAQARVLQAATGAEGLSAQEAMSDLSRSNSVAEQIILGNFKKAQRSLQFQREGISDARSAEIAGFRMQGAAIDSALSTPAWMQILGEAPDHILSGMNTYYNLVRLTGRGGTIDG